MGKSLAGFAAPALAASFLVLTGTAPAHCQFAGPAAPESALIEALQSSPDAGERKEAARLLGLQGSPAAISALASAAAFDPDRPVRIAAGDAIDRIRRRGSTAWIRPPGGGASRRLVESWYQLYLRRPADPVGLRDCLDRLRRGAGPIEVQAVLLGSDEYYRLHGSRPAPWVAGLYADVLNRAPSRHEIHHWVEMLRQPGSTRETVAVEFLRAAQAELSQRAP